MRRRARGQGEDAGAWTSADEDRMYREGFWWVIFPAAVLMELYWWLSWPWRRVR